MSRSRRRIAVICLLLANLLFPTALFDPVVAQPAPVHCPEGSTANSTATKCLAPDGSEVPPVTNNPGADDTTDGNPPPDNPPDPGTLASLSLLYWVCNADFEPLAVMDGGGGPANACGIANAPSFTSTISAGDSYAYTATVQPEPQKPASLALPIDETPIPAGTLTIAIAPVTNFALGMVYCDGPNLRVLTPDIDSGASATLPTADGMQLTCSVYLVSTVAEDKPYRLDLGGGSVTIGLLSVYCPAGTTAEDDLDRTCTDGASNVPFLVQSESQDLAANVTDGNGTLLFEDVQDGTLAIIETVPAGYGEPVVRCTVYPAGGAASDIEPEILYGNGFLHDFAAGDELQCTFYNMPALGPDNGPAMYLQYVSCEANSGVGTATTYDEAIANPSCYGSVGSTTLSVTFAGQVVATHRTNASGQVYFTKLPVAADTSTFTISKDISDQRPVEAVFCDRGPTDGPYDVIPVTLQDASHFDVDLGTDTLLRCTLFVNDGVHPTPITNPGGSQQGLAAGGSDDQVVGNGNDVSAADNPPSQSQQIAATDGSQTVTVQFWHCPDGIDAAAQQEDLLFACQQDSTNRAVKLATADGNTESTVAGNATWYVAGGQVALTTGTAISRAWCSATWDDGGAAGSTFPAEVDVTSGTLSLTFEHPGTIAYCDWFIAP